jgi:preprotein translocase subunit SecD
MKYIVFLLLTLFFISCTSKNTSGFYTKDDSLIFKCGDIISAKPFENEKGTLFVDIKFSKNGLKKLCDFEQKHLNEKVSFRVNDKSIISGIIIKEAISCSENDIAAAPMIFNTPESVYSFFKKCMYQVRL